MRIFLTLVLTAISCTAQTLTLTVGTNGVLRSVTPANFAAANGLATTDQLPNTNQLAGFVTVSEFEATNDAVATWINAVVAGTVSNANHSVTAASANVALTLSNNIGRSDVRVLFFAPLDAWIMGPNLYVATNITAGGRFIGNGALITNLSISNMPNAATSAQLAIFGLNLTNFTTNAIALAGDTITNDIIQVGATITNWVRWIGQTVTNGMLPMLSNNLTAALDAQRALLTNSFAAALAAQGVVTSNTFIRSNAALGRLVTNNGWSLTNIQTALSLLSANGNSSISFDTNNEWWAAFGGGLHAYGDVSIESGYGGFVGDGSGVTGVNAGGMYVPDTVGGDAVWVFDPAAHTWTSTKPIAVAGHVLISADDVLTMSNSLWLDYNLADSTNYAAVRSNLLAAIATTNDVWALRLDATNTALLTRIGAYATTNAVDTLGVSITNNFQRISAALVRLTTNNGWFLTNVQWAYGIMSVDQTQSIFYDTNNARWQMGNLHVFGDISIEPDFGGYYGDGSGLTGVAVSGWGGFVLPSHSKATRPTSSTGTMIFQTDNTPGLRVWNGTHWVKFSETNDD